MKNLLLISAILMMSACSDENNNKASASEIKKVYTLYRGDKLIKKNDDTSIEITQNSEKEYATVSVLKGSVEIIRK